MKAIFKEIQIGGTFHIGKTNAGFPRDGLSWCEFKKTSPSRAVCTKQVNYGNTRMEGRENPYAANFVVFGLEG